MKPVRIRTRTRVPVKPDTDPIGYASPPEHTRFRPGQSGNPKGRPKGSKSLAKILEVHLGKMVTVNIGGKALRMRLGEAIVQNMAVAAAKGENHARRHVLQMEAQRVLEMSAQAEGDLAAAKEAPAGPADVDILERYRRELLEDIKREQEGVLPPTPKPTEA